MANGSYDGLMGFVERNQINTGFMYIPYDTVTEELGTAVISPLPSHTAHIYSCENIRENDLGS